MFLSFDFIQNFKYLFSGYYCMAYKKSQITVYILLAMVLLIAASYIVYIKNISEKSTFQPEANIDLEKNSIKFYAQQCLNQILEDTINELGEKGGYIYTNPELTIQYTEERAFTFLYINRINFLPGLDIVNSDIKNYIERYINENLRYCVDDFVIYKNQGWDVEIADVRSEVTLSEGNVVASVEFPVKFTRDDVSFSLDKLFARNDVSLKKILEEVISILEDAEGAQGEIDAGNIPDAPPETFTRNGLLFLNYQYPNSGRFLWIIKENDFEFFFAINLEI